MPISGEGWEMHIIREAVQQNGSRRRTVGRYQVYHDGAAQGGSDMSGMIAEAEGPGANHPINNGKRVEAGRYPLWTQQGGEYVTWGYDDTNSENAERKPGFELKDTGARTEILVHPGHDFLASVGCINPCTSLPDPDEMITYSSSRRRVISLIEDIKGYAAQAFPVQNGRRIPNAFVVIDGEP